MIVILMGAPGAGKGTQADYLMRENAFYKISTGDILRRQIESKTELGRSVEAIMNQGRLVSDSILTAVLKLELENSRGKNIVLDGFPRTIAQAEWLAKNEQIAGVLHIDVDREELIRRIEGRLVCSQCQAVYHASEKPPKLAGKCDRCSSELKVRRDDERDRVEARLDVYTRETEPVLGFYKKNGKYFRVDGARSQAEVSGRIKELLSQLER